MEKPTGIYVDGVRVSNELYTVLEQYTRMIKNNPLDYATPLAIVDTINQLDIFFIGLVAHNIDRYMSTVLCEMDQSYTQQSQRYVVADEATVVNETMKEFKEILLPEDYDRVHRFITEEVIPFYQDISKVKEGEQAGGRDISKYEYGVPIEDARYVLPMWVNTTVDMTISFSKLFDIHALGLIEYCMGWSNGFYALWNEIYDVLNDRTKDFIDVIISNEQYISYCTRDTNIKNITRSLHQYEKVLPGCNRRDIVCISKDFNSANGVNSISTGALTSTSKCVEPDKVIGMSDEKKRGIIGRVTGYGHTSIEEHYQGLTRYEMSLSAYHQFLRHRIPVNRVNWRVFDRHRSIQQNVYIPESILKAQVSITDENGNSTERNFYFEYIEIMAKYRDFYYMIMERLTKYRSYSEDRANMIALRIVPNAAIVEVYSRSNLRADRFINRERLCMTAAKEIRKVMASRYLLLTEEDDSLYQDAVPPCFLGKGCKEGKMHCAYMKDIMQEYSRATADRDNFNEREFIRYMVNKYCLQNGQEY